MPSFPLTPKQFVSTSHPCTLSDNSLKQFFEKACLFIRDKIHHLETLDQKREVLAKIKQETIETINQVLKLYGYEDLISESEKFWLTESFAKEDDGKKISIRIMIVIFLYAGLYTKMVEELDSEPILQFFSYIEESVAPGIVKCAKEIAAKAILKETVNSFQMNIMDDMQDWQHIIMHFYTLLQVDFTTWGKQSIYEFGEKGCSSLSCFTMLALLKYFSEKKEKFYKDNTSGQEWRLREQDSALLRQILLFWSIFQEFMDRRSVEDDDISDDDDSEDDSEDVIPKRKLPHNMDSQAISTLKGFYCIIFVFYLPILAECIYDFSELPNTELKQLLGNQKVKDETSDVANSVLVYISGSKPLSAQFIKSLIDKDYEEVKDLSNSSIINNVNSRNCGKYVWIVKTKILNTICLNLEELCTPPTDAEYSTSFAKLEFALAFVFPFGDFLINTLNENDDYPSNTILKRIATLASLSLSRLFLSGNEIKLQQLIRRNSKFKIPFNYLSEFNLKILEIWKRNLYSSDEILRENTCFSLSIYFSEVHESRITDDLIKSVIKSFEANISNMSQYSILLSALIDKIEYSDSPFVDDFRNLLTRLFEIICKSNNGVEYMTQSNISDEQKAENHKKNIIFYFETLHDSYDFIKDGFEFKTILLYIKEKIEEIWRDGTLQEHVEIVSAYIVAIKEISRITNFESICNFFNESNYFTFLTKLIRSYIEYTEISSTTSRGSIYQLIGILSNVGLLDLCPFDNDGHDTNTTTCDINISTIIGKRFVYDFILPTIFEEALPPKTFFTDQIIIDASNLSKRIDTLTHASWALGRLMYNDLLRNDGNRSQAIFAQNIDRYLMVVKYLTSYDFYTTEEIRNLLLTYQDKILVSGLLLVQSRAIELIGLQFGKIFSSLCDIVVEEMQTNGAGDISLFFSLILLTDYMMDYHPESIALDEVAVFFAPILPSLLLGCNTYQASLVKRVFNKVVLID
ncbi:predicted protein [Naegleria gruberi]|uniref:Predicted protein n=1 Tax=Naegleria gruberi TaxID=5762 RepID=D2V8L4_NAEGR|nr:uncharacterized protein NAEGRDRAFT_65200 [Naegleria gruberi]EFC46825.1 predicted protein [Naegleria gruberi]|eukprot:XP_002679569.1 predicted protein [Naegleria gruberi strain NEG-M]